MRASLATKSMAELAKKAKVTDAYIAQLETGKRRDPSLEILKRLVRALEVPVTKLLDQPTT
jgi:transcriptional regulator with XRE-family HTH domain